MQLRCEEVTDSRTISIIASSVGVAQIMSRDSIVNERAALMSSMRRVVTSAKVSRRIKVVNLRLSTRCFKLPLFKAEVLNDLEKNGEENEAEVAVAYDLPRKAIKEANAIVDNGRWADLGAERASAVLHVVVAPERVIHSSLTGDGCRVKISRRLALPALGEVDIREGVGCTVGAEEVKESDSTADASSSDE